MDITLLEARDLPDAWFQCVYNIFDRGREYTIDRGSFAGQRRLEYDLVVLKINFPETRPLIPDIPPGLGLPAPTDMDYVNEYLEKLCSKASKAEHEDYTYGMYLEDQIAEVIRIYREDGFGTNQACMAVCDRDSIRLADPPCLRQIDTRIYEEEGKLHFVVYFRSWDLWAGFPSNLAGIQLLKEYMAQEIGVEPGETIAISKGLHLYEYAWDLGRLRSGKS
ncbi:MAG: thymidylate synthase [Candidatus Geothermincolia bacterium]